MAAAAGSKAVTKTKGGVTLAGIAVITLICAGAGVMFGFIAEGFMKVSPPKPAAEPALNPESQAATAIAIKPMPPITANLAQPSTTWIRLEAALVIRKDLGSDGDVVASKVAEDIIGFLRTLTIEQISGPSGFQHLREDLNDRIRVRSEGKASELIIQSMILE